MANKGFTGTQKQYLEGLASGLRVARGTTRSILEDVRARFASTAASLRPLEGLPQLADLAEVEVAQAVAHPQAATESQGRLAQPLGNHGDGRRPGWLEQPLSIHIRGCHSGCAQHDALGMTLVATRDPAANDGAELYEVWLGGEPPDTASFGRMHAACVPAAELSRLVQGVIDAYVARRLPDETFRELVERTPPAREPERWPSRDGVSGAGGLP